MSTLLAFLQDNPIHILKMLCIYLGNPTVFLVYLFTIGKGSLGGDGTPILGYPTFTKVSTNVHRMNLAIYLLLTFPLYVLWIALQAGALASVSSFNPQIFWSIHISWWMLALSIPGLLNLAVWSFQGMEGNIFGFIFGLPMLGATAGYIGFWIYALVKGFG